MKGVELAAGGFSLGEERRGEERRGQGWSDLGGLPSMLVIEDFMK